MTPSCTVIAHFATMGKCGVRRTLHTWIYKRAMKKIIINGQMRNKPFLIVINHSSLVKAAMNSARICKMRNGVSKTPSMSSFSNGQRRNEYSPQLSKL
jgi:hypothetical protein